VPPVWVRLSALGPELRAELDATLAQVRPPARPTPGRLLLRLLREALAARRRRRGQQLAAELRDHPAREGAGLPPDLQGRTLAAIARGERWLIPHLIRAGEWDDQIAAIARRWRQEGLTHAEISAAGMAGLLRAIRDWRPGPGWRSYAYRWITKEIERLCRASGSIVMETEDEMRVRRAVERHVRRGVTDPALLAKKTGLSPAQVARGLQGRRPIGWKEITER
jgi:hypothetical protein